MKLIYLSHWRFPSEKTMTPLILRTCAHFARLGWEVELWAPRRYNDYHADENVFALYGISPHFRIRRLPALDLMRFLGSVGFLLMVASFNLSAYVRLRRERDAVVYAHDIRDVILPCMRTLPVFVEIHDFYESSLRFINRFVFRRVSGLIVTNTHKIRHLMETYALPQEQMLYQPNAVDATMFDAPESKAQAREYLGLPATAHLVLYAGHLFGWKGVYTLADTAAFLPHDTQVYFVGGTTEDRGAMEAYVGAHELPRITFIPHQTPDKIPLWLRAADVLVLPNTAKEEASRVETSPVKLFEYMASGTPIVASDLPSIREIVSEREVLFAKPDDARSFADAIARVRADGDSGRREAARSLARASSWEARAQAIDSFIQRRINA